MTKSDNKLAAFKIGDTQKPTVSRQKNKAVAETPAPSLGFYRLEKLLEAEDAVSVSQNLNSLHQQLEAFQGKATTLKDKAAAKKALGAVEKAADLMDHLFATKASLTAQKT